MKIYSAKIYNSLFLFILATFFFNCKNNDLTDEGNLVCGTANPIEDLPWLNKQFKEFIGGKETNAIVLYKFDEKQIIEVQNSLFSSTNQHQYFCNGEKLDLDDANKFKEFKDNRQEIKVLYGTKLWY
ncbi:hypothetical protein SAMN04487995_4014 [Dyadobacter koreensis]|uniref:Uncharacterized protein n=1 Tax=Dyadobacter koreensis TaxID=408657 RepID=A0A1H6XR99_9BACT|nr:hypothetical protein [Dyadobacter koreensis]SEJ29297.1 hypothetical protein SAMN04487995_4014 [Dyadobacter koreensis]